jgi:hypothetical protein
MLVCGGVLAMMALVAVAGSRSWRSLPDDVCEEIAQLPMRRPNQHVVDLELKDGRQVRRVWVAWGRFPAMIGGRTITQRYRPRQVVHAHRRSDEGAA